MYHLPHSIDNLDRFECLDINESSIDSIRQHSIEVYQGFPRRELVSTVLDRVLPSNLASIVMQYDGDL
jgi:hypothetical protein